MAYIRLKWIKGYPYLYEQASYRLGQQVKTRHIRYIGRYGYQGGVSAHGSTGFQPPTGLTPERQNYIDTRLARLNEPDAYPYEREILRQVLYHHHFAVEIFKRPSRSRREVWGAVNLLGDEVTKFRLRKDSQAFTWLHELGHLMEFADHLVNDELTKLRLAFREEIARAYWVAGSVANKAAFIQEYGPLINLRQTLKTWTPGHKPVENQFIYQQLARVRAGEIPEAAFHALFHSWVNENYRLRADELFADSVAALILNPKFAFEVHGQVGKAYLSKLYIKLYRHFEHTYHISLGRPDKHAQVGGGSEQ